MMIPASLVLLLLFALVLIGISVALGRRNALSPDRGWGLGTRYFLVVLRLAIGWHFLVEGLDKINSPAWTSEPYLREASGPLAPAFRSLAGDSLRERLTLDRDGSFPDELHRDWQAYLDAFIQHYGLDEEQAAQARTVLEQQESKTLTWLKTDKKPVQKPGPAGSPPAVVEMTIAERLEELDKKEERVRYLEQVERPAFGAAMFDKLRAAKADVNRIRSELQADLARQTAAMKTALHEQKGVLTAEQKALGPVTEPAARPVSAWGIAGWRDFLVKWGLVVVGACLLGGLFTRTACVGGAVLLLLFYLPMPPLPDWPENPRAEGHYLYINKNIIEMLALLALATTRSGRWAGLDALLQFLRPSYWRDDTDQPPPADRHEEPRVHRARERDEAGSAVAPSASKETSHGS